LQGTDWSRWSFAKRVASPLPDPTGVRVPYQSPIRGSTPRRRRRAPPSRPSAHVVGHSFVRPAPRAFFRPDRTTRRRRAQGLSKAGRVFRGHPQGLALTGTSTAARLSGSGFAASVIVYYSPPEPSLTAKADLRAAAATSNGSFQTRGWAWRGASARLRFRNCPIESTIRDT
jgi:hypothetical protein